MSSLRKLDGEAGFNGGQAAGDLGVLIGELLTGWEVAVVNFEHQGAEAGAVVDSFFGVIGIEGARGVGFASATRFFT